MVQYIELIFQHFFKVKNLWIQSNVCSPRKGL